MKTTSIAATALAMAVYLVLSPPTYAAGCSGDSKSGGILNLDSCDEFEANGIYSRKNQTILDVLVIGGTLGVAVWQGTDSDSGRQAWKALDSMSTAAVATEVMKHVFERPRPSQSDDPDRWRQGKGNYSFPSGEVATMAAFVTPIIMDNHDEHPTVWGLTLLPLYMGVARLGSQAHWTSDVLVGAAVGVVAGMSAARRDSPLILSVTKDAAFVGLKERF